MGGNSGIKKRMIRKYGNVCFIEELGIRDKKAVQNEIKRYTSNKKQRQILDQITFHHIIERCKGGRATEENGALIRNISHQWFNRLPPDQQAQINALFQEYKRSHSREVPVELVDSLDLSLKVEAVVLDLGKKKEKPKFNRAKEKRDFDKRVEEGYEEYLDSLEEEESIGYD